MKISTIIIIAVGVIIPLLTNGDEKIQKISGILDKSNKNTPLLRINKNFSVEARGKKINEIPNASIIIATGRAYLDFKEINNNKCSDNWQPPLIKFIPYFIVKEYKILEANNTNKTRWEKRKKRHVVKNLAINGYKEKIVKSVSICNKDFNVSILLIGENPNVFGGYLGVAGSNIPSTVPEHKFDDLKYYLTPDPKKHKVSIRINNDFSHELKDYKIIYSEIAKQRNEIEVDTDLLKLWKIIAGRSERYKIDGIKVENYWKQRLAELPKNEKEFIDKFVSAYSQKDDDAMMKLIHPKSIEFYKSKNAEKKLLKIMNSKCVNPNLSVKSVRITKSKPEKKQPKKFYNKVFNVTVLSTVHATHYMWLNLNNGPQLGRGLVLENGKFFFAVPYVIHHSKDKQSNKE